MADSADSARAGTLRTIFLDRDGVLNEKMPEGSYVRAWADFRVLPGVPEAIARLNRAGVRVIVVSNQRGIALGLYSAADVEAIHASLQTLLQGARSAMSTPSTSARTTSVHCNCRKPLPGMFEDRRSAISLTSTPQPAR